jgi:hypothetical protein
VAPGNLLQVIDRQFAVTEKAGHHAHHRRDSASASASVMGSSKSKVGFRFAFTVFMVTVFLLSSCKQAASPPGTEVV